MRTRSTTTPRGKALEDAFFFRVNVELIKALREEIVQDERLDRLEHVSGIHNRRLLEQLLAAGIEAPTFAALTIVPCVFVAWADGHVTQEERTAILDFAHQKGLEKEPLSVSLLRSWLDHRPTPELWDLWVEYARSLRTVLSPFWRKALATELIKQARYVASVSGGIAGFGAISVAEYQVLQRMRKALEVGNEVVLPTQPLDIAQASKSAG
jgi:hypothetical protein